MVVEFSGLVAPKGAGSSPFKTIVALNRALRLRKSNEFQRVLQQGRSITSRLLVLSWIPNDVGRSRIGLVVSKRISKQAVERNHIKRLLSEAIRPVLHALPTGWDIVFRARNQAIAADVHMFEQDIATLLRQAGLLASPVANQKRELDNRQEM